MAVGLIEAMPLRAALAPAPGLGRPPLGELPLPPVLPRAGVLSLYTMPLSRKPWPSGLPLLLLLLLLLPPAPVPMRRSLALLPRRAPRLF